MKMILRQKIWLSVVVVANLALWVAPSNVVELIARDRQTLLGRYSREHFTWIIFVGAISIVSLYIDRARGDEYKKRWFRVIAGVVVFVTSLVLADSLLQSPERAHYIRDGVLYHRPPNGTFEFHFEDKPLAYRTYPNVRPGYGSVSGTCRTDARGFRNASTPDRADIVILGDSFAEGSNVRDENVWPFLLASRLGRNVVNLGMSGYGPGEYVAALERYGLPLRPRVVLCMVYEGNDFRRSNVARDGSAVSLSKRLKTYIKQSPIREAIDRLLISTLGPVNCHGTIRGAEILNWLPVASPTAADARYYAFGPEKLRDLYQSREAFASDRHWSNVRSQLSRIAKLCEKADARFVLVFAPTKAHVVLPPLSDKLPASDVRAFTAMSYKGTLPEPRLFVRNLVSWADGREQVLRAWCDSKAVQFISLTEPLRAATEHGVQTYYTYDQHWTPDGHTIVAGRLADVLRDD